MVKVIFMKQNIENYVINLKVKEIFSGHIGFFFLVYTFGYKISGVVSVFSRLGQLPTVLPT